MRKRLDQLPALAFGERDAVKLGSLNKLSDFLGPVVPELDTFTSVSAKEFKSKSHALTFSDTLLLANSMMPLSITAGPVGFAEGPGGDLTFAHVLASEFNIRQSGRHAHVIRPGVLGLQHDTVIAECTEPRNSVVASLSWSRLRETWSFMFGTRDGGLTFPDPRNYASLDSTVCSHRFHSQFLSLYALIDSFNCDSHALEKMNVEDTLYRLIAGSLTPGLLFKEDPSNRFCLASVKQNSLDAICDAVRSDVSTPLSLTEMQRISGYSARSLQLAFKERFGMTPKEWEKNERLTIAFDMLRDIPDGVTVTEVAYRTGFPTSSAFGRDFKRRFGISPGNVNSSK